MPLLPYNIIAARNERMYITAETSFGTYVTPGNSNACRLTKLTLTPNYPMYNRRDKTGSLSQTVGIKGRISGTFEVSMDLTGNGTAGMAPDAGILLNAAFGQTPAASPTSSVTGAAVSGSVLTLVGTTTGMQNGQIWTITGVTGTGMVSPSNWSVTVVDSTHFSINGLTASGSYTVSSGSASITGQLYTLSDNPYSFDIWSYRNINGIPVTQTNLEQRVAGSCVVNELTISFGQDLSTLTARGDCLTIMDSVYFPSASAPEKGGLSTFAYNSEPSAPVTNGYPSQGFIGLGTLNTTNITEIKTGVISIKTGRMLIKDTFGSFIPTGIEAGERVVTIQIDMDDSDDANLAALKIASKLKTPIPYAITCGNTPGNQFIITGSNLVQDPPTLSERGVRYQAPFPAARAYSSSYTTKDEISLVAG